MIQEERQALREAAARAYFEEGLEPGEIAARLHVGAADVQEALADAQVLAHYRACSEAAKLRAQLSLSRSVEEAARRQAELMRGAQGESVAQRAAKDILDRAGVGRGEGTGEIVIRFAGGAPVIGMPREDAP